MFLRFTTNWVILSLCGTGGGGGGGGGAGLRMIRLCNLLYEKSMQFAAQQTRVLLRPGI